MSTTNETTEHKLHIPIMQMPQAQYAHPGAQTEWWWHIGTLEGKGAHADRKFGFEINAAAMGTITFNQISLTDVKQKKHYQSFKVLDSHPEGWATSDAGADWQVKSVIPATSPVSQILMTAPVTDPTNMAVNASFTEGTDTITFDLQLKQSGAPLLVFGDGFHLVHPSKTKPLDRYNFYYSLTNLQVSGSVTINNTVIEVEGKTWMDHEFGAFPPSTKWLLQDIQLDNGMAISNTCVTSTPFVAGTQVDSKATVLLEDGTSIFIPTTLTPKSMKTIGGYDYFMEFDVTIQSTAHNIDATFTVTTLLDDQVFKGYGSSIYEGAGSYSGTYNESDVSGPAWIEQNLNKPQARGVKA